MLLCVSLAILWNPLALRYLYRDFVSNDTIFMLSLGAGLGLVVLTTLFCVAFFVLSFEKSRLVHRTFKRQFFEDNRYHLLAPIAAPIIDLAVTWILFILALAISPQILYTYYLLIFDGLPLQWIGHHISWDKLLQYIKMKPVDSLNTVTSGLSFWGLNAGVLVFWTVRYTNALRLDLQLIVRGLIFAVVTIAIFSLR